MISDCRPHRSTLISFGVTINSFEMQYHHHYYEEVLTFSFLPSSVAMSSLTQIAEEILANVKILDSYISSNNLPPASFNQDSFENLPPDLQGMRSTVINAAQTIRKLVLGPTGLASEILHSVSGPPPRHSYPQTAERTDETTAARRHRRPARRLHL